MTDTTNPTSVTYEAHFPGQFGAFQTDDRDVLIEWIVASVGIYLDRRVTAGRLNGRQIDHVLARVRSSLEARTELAGWRHRVPTGSFTEQWVTVEAVAR